MLTLDQIKARAETLLTFSRASMLTSPSFDVYMSHVATSSARALGMIGVRILVPDSCQDSLVNCAIGWLEMAEDSLINAMKE